MSELPEGGGVQAVFLLSVSLWWHTLTTLVMETLYLLEKLASWGRRQERKKRRYISLCCSLRKGPTVQPRLSLNSWSFCFCLLGAGITDLCCCSWLLGRWIWKQNDSAAAVVGGGRNRQWLFTSLGRWCNVTFTQLLSTLPASPGHTLGEVKVKWLNATLQTQQLQKSDYVAHITSHPQRGHFKMKHT